MLAALDVDYRDSFAVAACVCFDGWDAAHPCAEHTARIDAVAPYQPGRLYLRELPCLMAVLREVPQLPDVLVVDGYVSLGVERGLGAHLFDALAGRAAVVGVAKTRYASAADAIAVTRGESAAPLFVTAAGIDVREAAERVRTMHGPFRLPTLLKRADALARTAGGAAW